MLKFFTYLSAIFTSLFLITLYFVHEVEYYEHEFEEGHIIQYTVSNDAVMIYRYNDDYPYVVIPDTIDEMPVVGMHRRAFENNADLKSITFNNYMTHIPDWSFRNTPNLEEVIFSDAVRTVGAQTFAHTRSLEHVHFSKNIHTLRDGAFLDAQALRSITFAEDSIMTFMEANVFKDAPELIEIEIENLFNWRTIGARAFENAASLEHLVIPATVHTIGDSAFKNAPKLETVTFESGSDLTRLGHYIFEDNVSLKTVDFGEDSVLRSVGTAAFRNATALETLSLPDTVTTIEDQAFRGTTALRTIDISETSMLNSIGVRAFMDSGIESIFIPRGVYLIDREAFLRALSLSEVEFDTANVMASLSEGAFAHTPSLREIRLPYRLMTINTNAFHSSGLESISIPARVQFIEAYAFSSNHSLESLTFAGPSSLDIIGDYAFHDNPSLKQVLLPSSAHSIGEYAFAHATSMTDIYIPETVEYIGTNAFIGCEALTITTAHVEKPLTWSSLYNPEDAPVNWGA